MATTLGRAGFAAAALHRVRRTSSRPTSSRLEDDVPDDASSVDERADSRTGARHGLRLGLAGGLLRRVSAGGGGLGGRSCSRLSVR